MAAANLYVIQKDVAVTGTAVCLSATSLKVSSITIQAKGGDLTNTGANTTKIFIGPSTVDTTGNTGLQLAAPAAGVTPSAVRIDSGNSDNLVDVNDIYINGTAGDGVVAYYIQRS